MCIGSHIDLALDLRSRVFSPTFLRSDFDASAILLAGCDAEGARGGGCGSRPKDSLSPEPRFVPEGGIAMGTGLRVLLTIGGPFVAAAVAGK